MQGWRVPANVGVDLVLHPLGTQYIGPYLGRRPLCVPRVVITPIKANKGKARDAIAPAKQALLSEDQQAGLWAPGAAVMIRAQRGF